MTAQLPIQKERLEKIASWRETYGAGRNVMLPAEEAEALARFALAAHEQEPVRRVNADQMHRVCLEANRHLDKYGAMAKEINKLLLRHPAPVPAVAMPADLHPDTKKLVADFSAALAEKLYKAQLKYGYSANWKNDDWQAECLKHFHQHIGKGDPRDVAAYCAFMWYHGWKTETQAPVPAVPDECPRSIIEDAELYDSVEDMARSMWSAMRAAMLNGGKS